jgi:exopolyphosphatase/guanosine-5'-triphosphate,3'-diphosphate pyrophosphatase
VSAERVAAVDCGTNSIRLLVADVDPVGGTLVDVDRRMEIVRLGQDVDRTGRLAPEALERTFAACDRYAARIRDLGAQQVRFVATSASRDASNRDVFVAGVAQRFGVQPEVVPGAVEAALSFTGAVRGLPGARLDPPVLVVDIGGGSTELVLGVERPEAATSVDVGCVRMTERHVTADPPAESDIAATVADVDAALDRAHAAVPLERAATLVGLAGSVTTVAAIWLGLARYDSAAIHGARITADGVREVSERLLAMTREQRAALPVMHPGRVDVIGAGALVLRRIVDRLGLPEVVVSEHDILDGIAWSLVEPAAPRGSTGGPAGPVV